MRKILTAIFALLLVGCGSIDTDPTWQAHADDEDLRLRCSASEVEWEISLQYEPSLLPVPYEFSMASKGAPEHISVELLAADYIVPASASVESAGDMAFIDAFNVSISGAYIAYGRELWGDKAALEVEPITVDQAVGEIRVDLYGRNPAEVADLVLLLVFDAYSDCSPGRQI